MAVLSTARQFFDQLVAGGSASIEELVTKRVHETEWLDFKSGEHLQKRKETWSEAICGFANNQGGVLVWGIDARKDENDVDAASDIKPVGDPAELRSRLIELLRGAVEPPLPGVDVREFHRSGTTGPGYVVCFIPESTTKPHRAENLPNKPYMIRIADSFHNPSPALLRSLFFPRSNPKIEIDVSPSWSDPGTTEAPRSINILFHIHARNTGIVTVRDLYVVYTTDPVSIPCDTPYGVTRTVEDLETGIEYSRPLHPSSKHRLCTLKYEARVATAVAPKKSYRPALEKLEMNFDVYAMDMAPLRLSVTLGERDIQQGQSQIAWHRND